MYDERKDKFSIKDLIVQILLITLFVFLLMWLFPTKADLSKLKLGSNTTINNSNGDLAVLVDRIFNENIISMKDGAKAYYTTPRLPAEIGGKVKMTLGEMLDKHIILPFKDKNGKQCDRDASYVEITKESEEFIMKVNLKCSKEENYLLVYMGCYEYCEATDMCEKNAEDVKAPVVYKKAPAAPAPKPNVTYVINNITNNIINNVCPECCPKPPEPDKSKYCPAPNQDVNLDPCIEAGNSYDTCVAKHCGGGKPTPTPKPKEYVCEYIKTTNATFGAWGSWSSWTETSHKGTQLKQVKTKTATATVTKKYLTGYKVTTYKDVNKPIYKEVQVQTGTKTEKTCAAYSTKTENTGNVSYKNVSQGRQTFEYIPQNGNGYVYVFVSGGPSYSPDGNSIKNYYIYEVYKVVAVYETQEVKTCTSYTTTQTPVYTTTKVLTGYGTSENREPIYKDVQEKVEKVYYSYRTRKLISGKKDTKWDICVDSPLLNDGYEATGNKKEK
jgi:hypothetical protein